MRFYFSDLSIAEKIDFQGINLLTKTEFTRIFSSEGIFHVKDNKLMKLDIKDQPIENITIQKIDFLVDKSNIKYDVDWYQINPYHIAETIDVHTYALPSHSVAPHSVAPHSVAPHSVAPHSLQLILEKQDKHVISLYFSAETDDFNNSIGTFLSVLNLC